MEQLNNIPEPLLNQIKDLGKGLDKYLVGEEVIIFYDPLKEKLAGYYSTKIKNFVPNYEYFFIIDYLGINSIEDIKYFYNNIVIPNMGISSDIKLKDDYVKNKRIINFIETSFKSSLENGDVVKL